MHTPFMGELLGTMMLVLLGDGVVAAVLLQGSKAQNSGWIVITAGWAIAVLAGEFTAFATGSRDAHINPAVTFGFAIVSGDFSKLATYIPAQMAGGFLGGAAVWLHYLPHSKPTTDAGLKLAVFCTGPAIRNTVTNLISEVIGTTVLIFGIAAFFSKAAAEAGLGAGAGPFLVAVLVWGIGLSLGGPTGYAINPARDLGPRIAHAVLPVAGKGGSDWGYAWIPVAGPLTGAVLAAVLIRMLM